MSATDRLHRLTGDVCAGCCTHDHSIHCVRSRSASSRRSLYGRRHRMEIFAYDRTRSKRIRQPKSHPSARRWRLPLLQSPNRQAHRLGRQIDYRHRIGSTAAITVLSGTQATLCLGHATRTGTSFSFVNRSSPSGDFTSSHDWLQVYLRCLKGSR